PRRCSAAAVRAVLAALGVRAGDDAECQRELDRLRDDVWTRTVAPVTVVRAGSASDLVLHAPDGADLEVLLTTESGAEVWLAQVSRPVEPREVAGTLWRRSTFVLPESLPLGWHTVQVRVASPSDGATPADPGSRPDTALPASSPAVTSRAAVVVSPARFDVPAAVRAARPWGLMTQLYSVRSAQSWGIGDLADLRDLASLAARRAGADFVLVNPLHAAEPVAPLTPSPYLPTSRRFVNPLYIRVEDVPEVAYLPSAQRASLEWLSEGPRATSTSAALLDRDGAWEAKRTALEHVFAHPRTAARDAAFADFRAQQGSALEDFATWCAIAESHVGGATWPEELATPAASGVAAFRVSHRARIDFYAWLQWVADEQRASAQEA